MNLEEYIKKITNTCNTPYDIWPIMKQALLDKDISKEDYVGLQIANGKITREFFKQNEKEKKHLISYPLRVGRKQGRAILDANGIEVVVVPRGKELLAKKICILLNTAQEIKNID